MSKRITIKEVKDFEKLLNETDSLIFDVESTDLEKRLEFYQTLFTTYCHEIQTSDSYIGIAIDNFSEIEMLLCGVAQIWKKYNTREDFENYYRNSSFMRSLYCNERENQDLVNIYVSVNGQRYIVNWWTDKEHEYFKYKTPTLQEEGLICMLHKVFQDKFPNVYILVDDSITYRQYTSICEHTRNLGFNDNILIFTHDF